MHEVILQGYILTLCNCYLTPILQCTQYFTFNALRLHPPTQNMYGK